VCRKTAIVLLGLTLALGGCYSSSQRLHDETSGHNLPLQQELVDTPFYPQKAYQCGPAALATVLTASGVGATPDELVERVYIPDRRGSLQAEIAAAARERGRLVYVIEPDVGAVLAEIDQGRPVLVMHNQGLGWHYAVVIGYDAPTGNLILRSGTTRRRKLAYGRFIRKWASSNYWGIVLLEPGELPAMPDQGAYLRAAAAMERVGQTQSARAAFQVAVTTWPDSAAARFGLATAEHQLGELADARRGYETALELEPDNPAFLNNLAMVQLELDDCDGANAHLSRAEQLTATQPALAAAIADSRAEFSLHCSR
jgi:tetratricopeptide (TPR) repeat protein